MNKFSIILLFLISASAFASGGDVYPNCSTCAAIYDQNHMPEKVLPSEGGDEAKEKEKNNVGTTEKSD